MESLTFLPFHFKCAACVNSTQCDAAGGYCEPSSGVCEPLKGEGQNCTSDESCDGARVCGWYIDHPGCCAVSGPSTTSSRPVCLFDEGETCDPAWPDSQCVAGLQCQGTCEPAATTTPPPVLQAEIGTGANCSLVSGNRHSELACKSCFTGENDVVFVVTNVASYLDGIAASASFGVLTEDGVLELQENIGELVAEIANLDPAMFGDLSAYSLRFVKNGSVVDGEERVCVSIMHPLLKVASVEGKVCGFFITHAFFFLAFVG